MAKFSKKQWSAIAGELRHEHVGRKFIYATIPTSKEWKEGAMSCLNVVTVRLALMFERDNRAFDREHFLAICRGERPVNSRPPRS